MRFDAPAPHEAPPHGFAAAFDDALRHAPMTMGAIQQELARRGVTVSVATLSYWRSGRSVPTRPKSLLALGAIEEVLGLPVGTLRSTLPESAQPSWSPMAVLSDARTPGEELARLGLSLANPLTYLLMSEITHYGLPGEVERQDVRRLVRADADGLTRIPGIFASEPGKPMPRLVGGAGVRFGEVVELTEQCILVVELLFPRALNAGDTLWYEYSVEWQADDDLYNSHSIALPKSLRTATIGAVFHDEVPDAARLVHVAPDESERVELAHWDTEMAEIQFTQRHVPPGSLTLEWRMPGAEQDWS